MSTKSLPFDWVISDTHWQHKNINKYANRCTPSFPNPEDVDGLMIANWCGLVKPNDRVLHLGDLCFWGDGRPVDFLPDLPGKKFLLKGNHDNYRDDWYEEHGFEVVEEKQLVHLMHHALGEAVVRLTHYPVHTEELNRGEVNIHGHVHNNPHHSTPSHLNVSVELTSFAPLPYKDALEKVAWHHFKALEGESKKSNGKRTR